MAGRQGRVVAPDDSSWYQNTIQPIKPIKTQSQPRNAFDTFCNNLSIFNFNRNEKILPINGTEFDVLKSSDYNKLQGFIVGGPQIVSDELKSLMDYKRTKIAEMQQKEAAAAEAEAQKNADIIRRRLTPVQNRRSQ